MENRQTNVKYCRILEKMRTKKGEQKNAPERCARSMIQMVFGVCEQSGKRYLNGAQCDDFSLRLSIVG